MHRLDCVSLRPLAVVAVTFALFAPCRPCLAAFQLGAPEEQSWSDMAFPTGVSGNFNAGTKVLTVSGSPSNDLEIGSQFGPSLSGKHYGTGGTLGGPFSATLSVTGVVIQSSGGVTNGGSVLITFNGGQPGSLGTDYGIVPGNALLTGTVLGVQMDATGADTLDVLFAITGGALQNINGSLGTNFSPSNLGLLRFKSPSALPSDFSGSFTLPTGTTIDALGAPVPEFPHTTLVFLVTIVGLAGVSKCCFAGQGGVSAISHVFH